MVLYERSEGKIINSVALQYYFRQVRTKDCNFFFFFRVGPNLPELVELGKQEQF